MSRKRARPGIRDVIAERVFQRADGRDVKVEVGRPREVNGGEWECEFRVLGDEARDRGIAGVPGDS